MPITTDLRERISVDANMTAADWTPAKEQEVRELRLALENKVREMAEQTSSLARGICDRERITYAIRNAITD
jgi:hypothetical protein